MFDKGFIYQNWKEKKRRTASFHILYGQRERSNPQYKATISEFSLLSDLEPDRYRCGPARSNFSDRPVFTGFLPVFF